MSKLAIIILNKSNNVVLFDCIDSILSTTSSNVDFKIYIGDTGSTLDELNEMKTRFNSDNRIHILEFDYYNFAKNNNEIVEKHIDEDTELILFCNNDIKVISQGTIEAFIANYNDNIGTIGCKLLFANNSIQHAGQLLYLDKHNRIKITHRGLKLARHNFSNNEFVVGNTAAFMMISKKLFIECGRFNEQYKECFEDVELNLQCLLNDKNNLYLGQLEVYHYESLTRKKHNNINNYMRDFKLNLIEILKIALKHQRILAFVQRSI